MHTTIKKKIELSLLEEIFNNYADVCYIKHYICENEPKAEITIRHNEYENPSEKLKQAIAEVKKYKKLIDKLGKKDIQVYEYKENNKLCGYELNTYTDNGVNMIVFLDFRDTDLNPKLAENVINKFKDYVNSIDIDEEIELHRQSEAFRNAFTIKESLEDFEDWKKYLCGIFK
jgi:hypothetical protein